MANDKGQKTKDKGERTKDQVCSWRASDRTAFAFALRPLLFRVFRWRAQKLSALMTSPPAAVAIAHQTSGATVCLTNFTEPSIIVRFTPPGWNALAPTIV